MVELNSDILLNSASQSAGRITSENVSAVFQPGTV